MCCLMLRGTQRYTRTDTRFPYRTLFRSHRSDLPRHRARHDGGAETDARTRTWRDRAGRIGAVVSGDSTAVGVLRRQVRDPRLHRRAAGRIDARTQRRPSDDGATVGLQYAAVRLGALAHAATCAAGAADLPARDRGARHRLGVEAPPPRGLRRLARGEGDLGQQRSEEHTSELQSLMSNSYAVF